MFSLVSLHFDFRHRHGREYQGKPELLLDTSLQMSLHLSEEEIREAVRRLTKEISRDYAGTRPSHRPQFFQEIG